MASVTQTPAWKALDSHQKAIASKHMRDMFKEDPQRFDKFHVNFNDIFLDFSKNRITEETFKLLLDLAKQADVTGWDNRMMSGEKINTTEDPPPLHVAL